MLSIFLELIPLSLMQGLILSLPATGIMISFRLFNTADLTPEGTFTLGAAITGVCLTMELSQPLTLLCVIIGCGSVGALSRYISHTLKIDPLLSGIIILTMLFTVYLRIMGTSNLPLFDTQSLFLKNAEDSLNYVIASAFVVLPLITLYGYLKTYSGLIFLATGKNQTLCKSYGFSPLSFGLIAGSLASIFSGIGGSLMAQYQEFADVNMGIGILVQALASLMIGEVLLSPHTMLRQLIAPIIGSIAYQVISAFIISMGLTPTDLKLMTGVLVLTIIFIRRRQAT
ncbi:ABC transporter permease [Candidatus Bodocaedibacter vickermanii]|uniref:ABC transporter permease n=1 Tax=Candidatus Bodocaedibacter vickermanii TaxID=2741701 RepID=A0A7L9RS81_9PROT|nr:ABC transporter permease [Candidatus Paracaedibacteraceae bacterium 'Lake Konstanz']